MRTGGWLLPGEIHIVHEVLVDSIIVLCLNSSTHENVQFSVHFPNKYNPFINALWKEKVFLTFVSDYVPKHPEIKKEIMNDLNISNKIYKEFKKFLKQYNLNFQLIGENELMRMKKNINKVPSGIKSLEKYFKKIKQKHLSLSVREDKKNIVNGLLREFCRVLFSVEKSIEVSLINDVEYNKAIDIISDLDEYYRILGY